MAFAAPLTGGDDAGLTVDQVAAAAGLGIDTVRYYQRLGLIPAPIRKGRRAAYHEDTWHDWPRSVGSPTTGSLWPKLEPAVTNP